MRKRGALILSPDALTVLVRNRSTTPSATPRLARRSPLPPACRMGRSCLTVDDTGPGIAEAEYVRVFERFYRISGSNESGSGLGPAMRTIVVAVVATFAWSLATGRAAGERLLR